MARIAEGVNMRRWTDIDAQIAVTLGFVLLYSFALWVTGR